MIKKVAVFCGSSAGYNEIFAKEAENLGELLASKNIDLIYGGTNVGLMGKIANKMLEKNAKVTGVIPDFIKDFGLAHTKLDELIVVKTMHERKNIMKEKADAFIVMPGGYGTMEELFEVLSMSQLELHNKAVALFNINGFYDNLIKLLDTMNKNGFLKKINLDLLIVSNDAEDLLKKIINFKPVKTQKWEIV